MKIEVGRLYLHIHYKNIIKCRGINGDNTYMFDDITPDYQGDLTFDYWEEPDNILPINKLTSILYGISQKDCGEL